MKIIKQGIDPKTVPLHGKCGNCKTEVEFTKEEAQQSMDRNAILYSVPCPICSHQIFGVPDPLIIHLRESE